MDETPRVRRRWLWYGLPAILALIALVGIAIAVAIANAKKAFAAKLEQAQRQREAVEAIRRLGGESLYDYQQNIENWWYASPPGPAWLRERYGVDMVANVESVDFTRQKPTDVDRLDDAGLQQLEEHLKGLPRLKRLAISGKGVTARRSQTSCDLEPIKSLSIWRTSITDSGLEPIQRLTQLERLFVDETGITDAGLRRLEGLKHLKLLHLRGTNVTVEGVQKLQVRCPTASSIGRTL